MYVRIVWGRLKLGVWDEYERYYNENMEPITQGIEGFRGRQLLQSTENPDEGMSITLWDTLEALRNYDRSPKRQEASRGAERFYVGEYWVRNLEIKSSTL